VTAGVYQSTLSGTAGSNYDGWVAKLNPAASGSASLIYSTFLGNANNQFFALAADSSGDAYVTGNATQSGFPVTSGAFQYTGYESGSGGVYVTELNPTGTKLVYSAYLGYGTAYGIAVDGAGAAYVTGTIGYEDFPTTSGAYQTTYPGGFVAKLNAGGATEAYSTFVGGSSATGGNVLPFSIALESGCASACDAYISGYTTTTDFPGVNAIQTAASTSDASAFIVQLNATGASALFSSYLGGVTGTVYNANNSPSYGFAPALAVDTSGNMSVVGNLYPYSGDFPITIANANPTYAFLAKIGSSSSPFTWSTPTSLTFSSQPVGMSTSVYGTPLVVNIRNLSATAVTISSILASPASIFSASDSCAGVIPAGSSCAVTVNFDPEMSGTRTGTLTVTSNASNSPTTAALTGTGIDEAVTLSSATSLSFGPQNIGTASAPQLVTLTNSGDETTSLNISAYYGTNFSVLNNCSSPLPPAAPPK